MIETDGQLQQAYQALGDLYQALASYRAKVLPLNPRNYAVMAQGPVEEIRKIQAEIDAYLGLHEPLNAMSAPGASEPSAALRETPPEYGGG